MVGGAFTPARTYSDRVLAFLAAHLEDDFNAKSISLNADIPLPSIGQTIKRMLRANRIIRTQRGFYQHPAGMVRRELDPRIRFHGIKLEARCHNAKGWSFLDMVPAWVTRLRSPANHVHPQNGALVCYSDFRTRPVTITIHKKAKLLEEWCSSSSLPLHPIEFMGLGLWTEGWSGIPAALWLLRQIGANIDGRDVQLDWGLSQISLQDAEGRVLRAYQKAQDLLRTEVHANPRMPLEKVYELMMDIARPLEKGMP